MGSSKITIVGAPCGQHASYTFYKAFKYSCQGVTRILSLSEFFFVKISTAYPVSIGELQLIWTEKNNDTLLCSLRLYFLPENTPDGRVEAHGEDEVLASAEKLVLKAEDLVDWVTVCPDWIVGTPGVCCEELHADDNDNLMKSFAANNSGLKLSDVKEEKKLLGDVGSSDPQITILSYPRYCRFRAILKRLGNMKDKWLKNAIVAAIGGFTVAKKNSRVLFCKDTFDSADLESLEERCDHLAPNLKGRPRKKKRLSKDGSFSCSESEEPETPVKNGHCSNGRKPGRPSRMVLHSNKVGEEKVFLMALNKFMNRRNTPIGRMPSLGFKKVDLFVFYSSIKKLGGYRKVCEKRLWKFVYDKLGGHPGNTSAATCTRRHYEKLLLPFEQHQQEEAHKHQAEVRSVTSRAINKAKKVQLHKHVHEEEKWEQKKRKIPGRRAQSLSEKEKEWEFIRKQNALKRVQSKYSVEGTDEKKPVVTAPACKPKTTISTKENSSETLPEHDSQRQSQLLRRREAVHGNESERVNGHPSQPMMMVPVTQGLVAPLRVPMMQPVLANMPLPHGAIHPSLFRPGHPVQALPYMMGQLTQPEFRPSLVNSHVPVSGDAHILQNGPSLPKPPPAHSHKLNLSRPSVIQHTPHKGQYSVPPKAEYPAVTYDHLAHAQKPQPFVPGRTDKPRQNSAELDPYYKNIKRQRLNEEITAPQIRLKPVSERENLPPTAATWRDETTNDIPTDLSMKTLKANERDTVPKTINRTWIDIPVYHPQGANAPLNLRRTERPTSPGRNSSTPTGRASNPPRMSSASSYEHNPTPASSRVSSRGSPYIMDVTPPPHPSPALPAQASPAHQSKSSPAPQPRASPSSLPRASPASLPRGSPAMSDRHTQSLNNQISPVSVSLPIHPAFLPPAQYQQQLAMTQGLFPPNSPAQLQQMYEAQMQSMQANAAHMAFYGEMLQHPMFMGHEGFVRPQFSPQMHREGASLYRK